MASPFLRQLRAFKIIARGKNKPIQSASQKLPHIRKRLAGFELLVQQRKRESMFKAPVRRL